jgi:hypothetical protein
LVTLVSMYVEHTARLPKWQRKWKQETGKILSFEDLPPESQKTESNPVVTLTPPNNRGR